MSELYSKFHENYKKSLIQIDYNIPSIFVENYIGVLTAPVKILLYMANRSRTFP